MILLPKQYGKKQFRFWFLATLPAFSLEPLVLFQMFPFSDSCFPPERGGERRREHRSWWELIGNCGAAAATHKKERERREPRPRKTPQPGRRKRKQFGITFHDFFNFLTSSNVISHIVTFLFCSWKEQQNYFFRKWIPYHQTVGGGFVLCSPFPSASASPNEQKGGRRGMGEPNERTHSKDYY